MAVLSEYPRPGMRRQSYISLNGVWKYAIREEETTDSYDGEIMVPYSPEAELSGVRRQLLPGQWLHYYRTFEAPPGEKGRVLLHFGAVDYLCRVYVNGQAVGEHRGGYLAFALDITEKLRPGENELIVKVQDPSDAGTQARGKQKLQSGGMYYTAQSGIWKSVWMERVPENYIREIRLTPEYDQGQIHVQLQAEDPRRAEIVLYSDGKEITRVQSGEDGEADLRIPEEERRPWCPEDPFLYEIEIRLGEDSVWSYTALRKYEIRRDDQGILRFFLNGKPYFLHGLLDQGYWKEGLYTPPSDEAMRQDILRARSLGFNMLRKHVKIEAERWYYHCDRMGMIVWQDMVNGGGTYKTWFVTYAANIFLPLLRGWKDHRYSMTARTDEKERQRYYEELEEMVRQLYNHPSIACWTPFNEGWGQFDAGEAVKLLRSLDTTRLVEEASGWFDQGGGDFDSIHNYFYPLRVKPDPRRAVLLSEYGGIACALPGHTQKDKTYGYGIAKNREELAKRYRELLIQKVLPQIRHGLSGLIYTQLSDVEEEVNGILTADREEIKLDPDTAKECARMLQTEFFRCVQK